MKPAWAILATLFFLCLAPRALMALKVDVLCLDGVFYVELARKLEAGDLEGGLGPLRLNTYPPILMLLHRAGLGWEDAGRLWGVLAASATVLPLFGWVRRQFDNQTAKVACLLYAVHPKFISWSPEVVRDQTFWLLLACSLYSGWRAVYEVRWRWFLATGVAIALAMHTRFEGWFAWLPLALWTAWRAVALAERRWRLAGGLALAAAAGPALLVLVNVTWLRDLPRWELGNFSRLEYVSLWARTFVSPSAGPGSAEPQAPPAGGPAPRSEHDIPRMSFVGTLLQYANTMRRGLGAVFAVAMLWGIWRWRRVWARRDHQPVFYAATLVAAGMYIHLWYAQASSSRYPLSIALMGTPFAALGCLSLAQLCADRFARVRLGELTRLRVLGLLVLLTAAQGWVQSLAHDIPSRQRDAALGRWVRERLGPGQRVAAQGTLSLVAFYADGTLAPLSLHAPPAELAREAAAARPDVVVCSRKKEAAACENLRRQAAQLNLRELSVDELPPACGADELVVLVRKDAP